ncbi:MAG: DUF262 domain-containing protein [candidate division Zixibacteria bacterium]|nr:DUF262 domain-containing protein [candidate division Zixibacteria bacterium]
MGKIFDATPEKLNFLLESIHNRETALPDFQRDFVWDPSATEELIKSICQSFPAGSLLRIRNNNNGFFLAQREFSEAPSLNKQHPPSYLVLDGQQRLTSLYQAFYGVGSHQYFINLKDVIDGKDLEDCLFYLRKRDGKRRYGTVELQAKALTFPLSKLFGESGGFEEWLDNVLELRSEAGEKQKQLKMQLRDARKSWLQPIDEYHFPVVTLPDKTDIEAVCTIFETLNRTGVKLSVFDLLTARFWPEKLKLRDLWDKAQTDHPIIADFEIDPYYILQAIALRTAKAPSCKRSDVLKMDVSKINTHWKLIVKGMANSLHLLRDDCGVVLPKWLPSASILIPMAAIQSHVDELTGPEAGAAQDKIKKWFWCSVFGQAYEKAANSQAAKDYGELKKWIEKGEQPETVVKFTLDKDSLRQVTPRQRGIYRGIIAIILRHGARDFHNCTKITANIIKEKNIDDHHVFPKAYINEHLQDISPTQRDCILNRTLIDKTTNIRIGKRPPSDYLAEIQNALGEDKFADLLDSHLLPSNVESGSLSDSFDSFLDQREKLIIEQINEVTKGLTSNKSSIV